jgi:hypothetical protein
MCWPFSRKTGLETDMETNGRPPRQAAANTSSPADTPNPAERDAAASRREDRRREKFARAMARSEFGRHYWDITQEAERRADRKRPAKT